MYFTEIKTSAAVQHLSRSDRERKATSYERILKNKRHLFTHAGCSELVVQRDIMWHFTSSLTWYQGGR